MRPLSKLLLAAALLLLVAGIGLVVVQPGDLGDDETEAAGPGVTEPDDTTSPTAGDQDGGDAGTDGDATTSTTAARGGADGGPSTDGDAATDGQATTTTTTAAPATGGSGGSGTDGPGTDGSGTDGSGGSGLDGGPSTPDDLEDGLAATGGTSMLALAVLLATAGLALARRRT